MNTLKRFHWISGADDFRRREQLRAILKQEIPEGLGDFNFDRLDGRQATAESLLSVARTPPMMAERRVLQVEELEALSREACEALLLCAEEALERQRKGVEDFSLVVSLGVGKSLPPATQHLGKKLQALAGQCHEMEAFDEERDWERAIWWCQSYVQERQGRSLSEEAARSLAEAIGIGDTGRLAGELDKLDILARGAEVTPDLIERVVGVTRGRTLWDLCDRVGERDLAQATAMLPEVLSRPDQGGIRVATNLAYRVAKIGLARTLMDEGQPAGAIRARVKYPADKILAQARRWSLAEVDRAMDALLETDLELKRGARDEEALLAFLHEALSPERSRTLEPITPLLPSRTSDLSSSSLPPVSAPVAVSPSPSRTSRSR